MPKSVQIIPAKVGDGIPYFENKPAQSEFWFDGSAYILHGNQIKSVPDKVADAWVAHDSNVRILWDR